MSRTAFSSGLDHRPQNSPAEPSAAERRRIPMILANSEFSSNPFQTIRKHAQNTLVKHQVPK